MFYFKANALLCISDNMNNELFSLHISAQDNVENIDLWAQSTYFDWEC